ncbi:MAG TPA: helix-turn-helix transcriptional regulator [Thermoleophilaceae bacterium]|jgi:DNA-binding NarL/FixJ family response regulator|nr:helix-turn-helix transcriptional regulator [Thermoleophilaceae bacterium]
MAQGPTVDELERGRKSCVSGTWKQAHESLSRADRARPLAAEDLELLATSAYMLGQDDEYVSGLERAHHAYLHRAEALRAARCAFWIGMNLVLRGEAGPASGWLSRTRRLVEREGRDCVEGGYLRLPAMFELEAAGDRDAAIAAAAEAAAIGERFEDADLFALATHNQGILLIEQGRVAEGLALLDEAMVAVTAGELSPIINGYVYCGVITGCQAAYDSRRAQEWTAALTRWCEAQPDMVSFSGTCLVHRAEIMQLHGAWSSALDEARRAGERCAQASNRAGVAEALYRQGELHRLRGEFAAAEEAYRSASRSGLEPQPGLALMRLAEGRPDAAAAAVRRLVAETSEPVKRAGLLPAFVEIMLADGDLQAARAACEELAGIAERWGGTTRAVTAHARGALELADGDAAAALVALRQAQQGWRELEAPYEAARAGELKAMACAALGDEETAALELEAARSVFELLGAAPDLARLGSLAAEAATADAHRLTARELEVLRLVAAGRSNREISAELVISEHTVARHLQNIFAKLGVSSRTAASAFAFAHDLV